MEIRKSNFPFNIFYYDDSDMNKFQRQQIKVNKLKLLLVFGLLMMFSCKTIFKTSPYQSYVTSLKNTGLASTEMGQKWLHAGENVMMNPNVSLRFPFKEEVFFRAEQPAAIAYQIDYKKSFQIKFSIKTSNQHGVFVDFFENLENPKSILNEYLKDTTFNYESSSDQKLVLRLQPQLLTNEHVIVEVVEKPKLAFPVKNGNNKDIKSFWGVDRDGGARKHEGVDIFNKRGTPILAVEDGTISRVQITNLGGKVVWQRLGIMGPSIYYAHLDSQMVSAGQKVKRGETIGLMGNTGNAITTSPHLHFGIYTSGGAINPIDYIYYKDTIPKNLKAEHKYLGKQIMIEKSESILPVNVLAVSTNNITYQDYSGAIEQEDHISISNKKIRKIANPDSVYLLASPKNVAIPIAKFNAKEQYSVLGIVDDFLYIEQNNNRGWVSAKH